MYFLFLILQFLPGFLIKADISFKLILLKKNSIACSFLPGPHLNYDSHRKCNITVLDSSWIHFGNSTILQSKQRSEKFWVAVRKLCNFQYFDNSDSVDRLASIVKFLDTFRKSAIFQKNTIFMLCSHRN